MTLGTPVTIRLDGRHAERLREVADRRRVGYTTLLRAWIEERLAREAAPVTAAAVVQAAGVGGVPPVQVTGAGRLVG